MSTMCSRTRFVRSGRMFHLQIDCEHRLGTSTARTGAARARGRDVRVVHTRMTVSMTSVRNTHKAQHVQPEEDRSE